MKSRTSHVFAALLFVGGLFGIGMGVIVLFASFIKASGAAMIIDSVLSIGFIALFAWTLHVSMLLFTGKPKGWRWAIILYATQIPVIANTWFHYEWFTGIRFDAMVRPVNERLMLLMDLNAGANISLDLDKLHGPPFYGINLLAVLAVTLLIRKRRQLRSPAPEMGKVKPPDPDSDV